MNGVSTRMREACQNALWNPAPTPKEVAQLTSELEGYVRELSPQLAALVPRMGENMQSLTAVVLRHVDEVLDERAPRVKAATRLQDLGVVVRAVLAVLDRPGDLAPGDDEEAEAVACDPGGWLLVVPRAEDSRTR